MSLVVNHRKVTSGTTNPKAEVSLSDWNDSHTVSGNLDISQLNNGASASALTFWRGDGTWATPKVGWIYVITDDFGADPTGQFDSAPAFRAAIAAMPSGSVLYMPPGQYLLNSFTNNAILDFSSYPSKSIQFIGAGWNHAGSASTLQGTALLLGGSITSGVDFFHQAPVGFIIGGMAFKDFGISTTSGVYAGALGRHGFFFDGSADLNAYYENLKIENVFIDNMATGYSIYSKGQNGGQGVMANAVIHGCKLMQIRAENWGDSNTVRNCVFGTQCIDDARNLGIYLYNVSGATNPRILHNFFVSKNGMIQDDGSIKAIYDGNEFESVQTNSLGYMVHLKGGVFTIQNPTITNSRISQLLNGQTYVPFQLDNVRAASLSKNWISTPTSYSQIVISGSAAYTLIESDNESNVNGTPVVEALVSDGGLGSVIRSPLRWTIPQANTLAAPSAGRAAVWFDTTDQRLHDVNSAGAFATTVGPSTAPTHQFAKGIGNNGVISYAQPAITDISGIGQLTNSLGADVTLTNTTNYFDGPSVAQGTTGTWFASGTVTLLGTASDVIHAKLWDGTTVLASGETTIPPNTVTSISLSGIITTPAANIRISVQNTSTAGGKILFNLSSGGKDSTITAFRIG